MQCSSIVRRLAMASFAALAGLVSQANAQDEVGPEKTLGTSCFQLPARLSDTEIQAFLDNPSALLSQHLVGGLPLQNRVRSLVGSSSAAFEALLTLIPDANEDQAAAIGAGLARAVDACSSVDADYADRIQTAVAELDNQDLLVAFSSALGQPAVGAIDGGAGGQAVIGGNLLTEGARNASGSNNRSFGGDVLVPNLEGPFIVGSAGNFVAASASAFEP